MDIEILFQTSHLRMEQVVECNSRNDMPIPHDGIRKRVQEEDAQLRKSQISARMIYILHTITLLTNHGKS